MHQKIRIQKKSPAHVDWVFVITLIILFIMPTAVLAAPGSTPGQLESHSTIHSIGLDWDITGDDNHNAVSTVQYRVQGSGAWKQALPLVRVDLNGLNMLAGSIFFLQPGTTYDVKLDLSDPDGGSGSQTISVTTRSIPILPTGGNTYHVIPGSGGGTGTEGDPLQGISAAQAVAAPGDIFLLHAGDYGIPPDFTQAGTENNHIVWKSADDGEVILNANIYIAADYIWFEGIHFKGANGWAVATRNAPEWIVFTRNSITDCGNCVYLNNGGNNWYIVDNTIAGIYDMLEPSYPGEGFDLEGGHGHIVAYNKITGVGDGISVSYGASSCITKDSNIDIYGNDIYNVVDDGIEGDGGCANVRIWGNRIHNARHNSISFQPQSGAPWYIIRNQIVNNKQNTFKYGETDRVVLYHNIFVIYGMIYTDTTYDFPPGAQQFYGGQIYNYISKNNIWISMTDNLGASIWDLGGSLNWRTDVDYDGFGWSGTEYPFWLYGAQYSDIASFANDSGIEENGIFINKDNCFETFDVGPIPVGVPVPTNAPEQHMTLKSTCNAVDHGPILPNINDGLSDAYYDSYTDFRIYQFTGSKSDLGPYEYGQAVPHYGPRGSTPPPTYQCSDGRDNDGDGLTDYPNDPDCSSSTDNNEYNAPPPSYQCSDGVDNDGDGLTDYPNDPGCSSSTDNNEYNAVSDSNTPAPPSGLRKLN